MHSWNLHLGRVSLYSLPAGGVRGQPEPSPPLGIFILPASRGSPWPKGSWRVVPLGLEEGKRRTRGHKVARVLLPNRSQISSLSDYHRCDLGPWSDEPIKDGPPCDFPHHRDESFFQFAFPRTHRGGVVRSRKYSNYSAHKRTPLDNL